MRLYRQEKDKGGKRIMETGVTGMFSGLTATGILAEATKWTSEFDGLLLVVVGMGCGFAAVRFVKSMFF